MTAGQGPNKLGKDMGFFHTLVTSTSKIDNRLALKCEKGKHEPRLSRLISLHDKPGIPVSYILSEIAVLSLSEPKAILNIKSELTTPQIEKILKSPAIQKGLIPYCSIEYRGTY